jgi:hypothetical protein
MIRHAPHASPQALARRGRLFLECPLMKALVRIGICAVVGLLAVLLLAGVLVPWLGGPALLDGDVSASCRVLWIELVRRDALHARDRTMVERLEIKRKTVEEIVAGRLTLQEAAERFRASQGPVDDGLDDLIGPSTVVPDDLMSLNVIRWVSCHLREDPPRQAAVLARLKKELERSQKCKADSL